MDGKATNIQRSARPKSRAKPPRSEKAARTGIQTVARVANVLRALEGQQSGLSLGQIAKSVGQPRPTVQRLVDALKAEGLVAVDATNGGVRLGPSLVRLAASVRLDVPMVARPHIERLVQNVNETVAFAVLSDGEAIVLHQIPANRNLQLTVRLSAAWQLHTTADGKALLEGLDADAMRTQFVKSQEKRPIRPRIRFEDFERAVELVRRAGFAVDSQETTDGVCAIAAGFLGLDGKRYSISILAPPARFEEQFELLKSEILKCRAAILATVGHDNLPS